MIKVCYIITKLDLGGAQKVALYIAKNIDKNMFDSFVISGFGGVLDDDVQKKLKFYQLKRFVREISLIKDIKTFIDIYLILKKEKPDIVHTHTPKAGILGRLAAKLAGVQTIVHTIHGYGFSDEHKWYLKYLFIWAERLCALFSTKLIFVSEENIKKGFKYRIVKKNNFELIRAGIDTGFYKNFVLKRGFKEEIGVSWNTKIVVTVSSLKSPKNLKDFINVANEVTKSIKDVVFVIVGDGEQREDIESLIKKFNLTTKVILLGWRTDIANILKSSDIFILTSLWEGLPCSILEAMCCSKPVIANAIDGIKEIVLHNKTGFLIEPNNYKQMAEKVKYLLLNKNISKEMGEIGCNLICEEFDINYALKQHENLYLNLYSLHPQT
ncbi:MAG: glycosyltransferase family 4 protein [Endomicrobium sp.]|nr:glycosyltransferase family 4 protein [Endomicrobium sp.]